VNILQKTHRLQETRGPAALSDSSETASCQGI